MLNNITCSKIYWFKSLVLNDGHPLTYLSLISLKKEESTVFLSVVTFVHIKIITIH